MKRSRYYRAALLAIFACGLAGGDSGSEPRRQGPTHEEMVEAQQYLRAVQCKNQNFIVGLLSTDCSGDDTCRGDIRCAANWVVLKGRVEKCISHGLEHCGFKPECNELVGKHATCQ